MKKSLSAWKIIYRKFDPSEESLRETLCALGNGFMVSRGAHNESMASRIHYPGTYIAGVYNKTPSVVAGKKVYNEDLVNCPNWFPVSFKIDDNDWIVPSSCKILSFYQELNIFEGTLLFSFRIEDPQGNRTKIESIRFISMANSNMAGIKYSIIPENYDSPVTFKTSLDGNVENKGVARYRSLNSKHLKPVSAEKISTNTAALCVRTSHSKIKISLASKIKFFDANNLLRPKIITLTKPGETTQQFTLMVKRKKKYTLEKTVSIFTSSVLKQEELLQKSISALSRKNFRLLLTDHKNAWKQLWNNFDIQLTGDAFTQKILRFHSFHLLQTASNHIKELDVAIPARGLHGEAYRGHIFWDELFVLPFFDFREPDISRSVLMYRHSRLKAARKYAKENGYLGAMFPWQSGMLGQEETQEIHLNPLSGKWGPDYSRIQRHVSFAIAYNIWKHWERTEDLEFLTKWGAEIFLSIAKFGICLCKYDRGDGKYHTFGLMGPDEFHEKSPEKATPGYKDNAYTNFLIAWTLIKARELLTLIPKKELPSLLSRSGISKNDINLFTEIPRKMSIIMNKNQIISQFEGYFQLQELNKNAYKKKYHQIERMDRILKAEGKSPNDYKISKQADALMIFYLFPFEEINKLFNEVGIPFNFQILKRNYEYYIKRTSHGSTLSLVVHGFLAILLEKNKEAWDWYQQILRSDIMDIQGGTTPEGIHAGVMGGSIDIFVRGFLGINFLKEKISISPRIPKKWKKIKLNITFQDKVIYFTFTNKKLLLFFNSKSQQKYPFEINNHLLYLSPNERYQFKI